MSRTPLTNNRTWQHISLSGDLSFAVRSCTVTAIDGVVEESADIMDEEGIEEFGDFFFVGEVEGSVVGDPVVCSLLEWCGKEGWGRDI